MVKVNKRNTHYHYYLKTKPDIDTVDLGYFHEVYDDFIGGLTQGFLKQDCIRFYSKEESFIENVARKFGKRKLGHFILFTWNQDRIHYLRNFMPDDLKYDVEDYASRFNS